MDPAQRAAVIRRARGRCEAHVIRGHQLAEDAAGGRCTRSVGEVHHRLFRSRGGRILESLWDERPVDSLVGFLGLCKGHHDDATDERRPDLNVRGQLFTHKLTRQPYYVGPDPLFRAMFPRDTVGVQ